MGSTIILFAYRYPSLSSTEKPFIDPELECLASSFDRVILVPSIFSEVYQYLPENVIVDDSFALKSVSKKRHILTIFRAIQSWIVYSEIARHPNILLSPRNFARMLITAGEALRLKSHLKQFVSKYKINLDRAIFYTYWFGAETLGVGLYKESEPNLLLVTRAHGGDLYEELYKSSYIPYRSQNLAHLDRLYLISKYGEEYINNRYPQFESKYLVARLGIKAAGFRCLSSQDNILRIVSCSFVKPVKRLDLLIEGLQALAEQHVTQQLQWTHIGADIDNPLLWNKLVEQSNLLPDNIIVQLLGNVTNDEVYDFYKKNPVDVFVNVSSSEGIPVTIIEAASCGIPIVATSVGGTPEIVGEANGKLLDKDPRPVDIAEALWDVIKDKGTNFRKRDGSLNVWHASFSAERNHTCFVKDLISLLN